MWWVEGLTFTWFIIIISQNIEEIDIVRNAYDKRHNKGLNGNVNDESATLFNDPIMGKLMKDDPDFNSSEKHSLEEIIKHDAFEKYIHHEGWESDNPPLCCVANCRVDK